MTRTAWSAQPTSLFYALSQRERSVNIVSLRMPSAILIRELLRSSNHKNTLTETPVRGEEHRFGGAFSYTGTATDMSRKVMYLSHFYFGKQ